MESMDGDLLKEASRIWAMLDEMAENDPQKYRKFIDKQMEEGRRAMSPPEPHCVIQTAKKNCLESFFINVCSWSRIPEPKTDTDPISILSSDIYSVDDNLSSVEVISVACAPGIVKRYGQTSKNEEEKEGFICLLFEFLREVKKISLSETWTVLKCLDLKGSPEELYKGLKFDPMNETSQIDSLAKTVVPDGGMDSSVLFGKVNDFISKKESSGEDAESYSSKMMENSISQSRSDGQRFGDRPKEKILIEELPFIFPHEVNIMPHEQFGRTVSVKIKVEGISSVKECNLFISKTDLRLKVSGSKGYLDLSFPEEVIDTNARAQFKKKQSLLIITVPVRKPEVP